MPWYFYVGLIAAVCIAIFSMPQLIQVIKTKNTSGLALGTYLLLTFGDICFVLDGIGMLAEKNVAGGLPIFLANIVAFATALCVLIFKLKNMRNAKLLNITEKQYCSAYKEYHARAKQIRAQQKKLREGETTPSSSSPAA